MTPNAASPCVGICRLDERSLLCIGCWRTIQEIARWTSMSRDERARVFSALERRRASAGGRELDRL